MSTGRLRPPRPGDIRVHPEIKWTRGKGLAHSTARLASQVSRLGFPVPRPSRPRFDSRVSTLSRWNRVPSRLSFTNAWPARWGAGLGQGQKGSLSAKGVTGWPPQPPGASPRSAFQQTGQCPCQRGLCVPGFPLTLSSQLLLQVCFSSQLPQLPLLVYSWPRGTLFLSVQPAFLDRTEQLPHSIYSAQALGSPVSYHVHLADEETDSQCCSQLRCTPVHLSASHLLL